MVESKFHSAGAAGRAFTRSTVPASPTILGKTRQKGTKDGVGDARMPQGRGREQLAGSPVRMGLIRGGKKVGER